MENVKHKQRPVKSSSTSHHLTQWWSWPVCSVSTPIESSCPSSNPVCDNARFVISLLRHLKGSLFHLHCPDGHNWKDRARLKPGACTSIQIFYKGSRDPSDVFPRTLARRWATREVQTWPGTHGILASQWLNLLPTRQAPGYLISLVNTQCTSQKDILLKNITLATSMVVHQVNPQLLVPASYIGTDLCPGCWTSDPAFC